MWQPPCQQEGASVVTVGEEADDLLGGGIPVDQVLLQGAQLLQGALIDGLVDAARQLHMRIQLRQLLPAEEPGQVSALEFTEPLLLCCRLHVQTCMARWTCSCVCQAPSKVTAMECVLLVL